ncbi:hypothetical protein BO70DRAFT_207475 [Aspergillus heteromorphus CBS 117.55]|uniref:Uncharacterized protein n=1 Tax=Aspergillus heteromorphus CBS 117.55 TaxID=1448321 RepID=A0A317UQI0_9EURO|nr:uncharacterized protein BO70DRAFT_207475 [Aspergillus heteromorphus CBS 117.55]PWY64264.1 hypothetical protein BO70DRAFT_207475 [Aspergillus heteromorphus CBS 117.55]
MKAPLNMRKGEDDGFEFGEETMVDLWEKAFAEAKGDLKFKPGDEESLADFHTANFPLTQTEALFQEWRHPKADTPEVQEREHKIREYVQQCLGWAQTTCTYAHDHASGTFAEPVKLLSGGIAYLLKAAQDVSTDLNTIQSTFQTIASAMQEIHIMEKHPVVTPTAKESLVKVFIALLYFCSYVGSDLRNQTRLAMWRKKVLRQETDLAQKQCEKVEQAVTTFHDAIRFESYNDIKEIKEGVHWLIKNTNTKMQQTVLLGGMYSMSEKGNVLDKLAKTLQGKLHLNLTVLSQMATRMDEIMPELVKDGFRWLASNDLYQQWLYRHDTSPVLYIRGSDGVGKTSLTAHCYQLIPNMAGRNRTLVQKETVRQQLIVTYFLFEPGMQYFQNFPSVIASILFQIAAQDPKWCDSISGKAVLNSHDPIEIWKDLVLKRFEKKSHSSEELYILLDGISDMQAKERDSMLRLFYESLSGRDHRVWILLTGSGKQNESFPSDIVEASPIPMIEMTTDRKLAEKIIEKRMARLDNLRRIRPESEGYRLISEYLFQSSNGNLSILDQTIEILDQNGTDKRSFLKFMEGAGSGDENLIRHTLRGSDATFTRAVKKVLLWCAFAKRALTVSNLNDIIRLDDDLQANGIKPDAVLERCRDLLYIRRVLPSNLGPPSVNPELYWCSRPDHETGNQKDKAHKQPLADDYEYVDFRQAKLKKCIQQGGTNIYTDVNAEKVEIFVTLCDILCGSSLEPESSLPEYAAFNLIRHLREIDLVTHEVVPVDHSKEKSLKDLLSKDRETKEKEARSKEMKPQSQRIKNDQLKRVGKALYRVLTNETGVSAVFEKVQSQMDNSHIDFDLYDTPSAGTQESGDCGDCVKTSTNELIRVWAEEMIARDRDDHLSLPAHIWSWADIMKTHPARMLENLARGHLQSWVQKSTAEEARVPYKLAFRAFFTTGRFQHWSRDEDQINASIAEDMLGQCRDSRTRFAQARLAAALLLYESPHTQDRDYALFLYEKNRHLDESMCAEKLYSLLGLASHYTPPHGSSDTASWEKVKKYTEEALKCWKDSDAALRPNFNPEQCKNVYMLNVKACMALKDTKSARKACQDALNNKFLRHCRALGYFLTVLVQIHAEQEAHSSIIQTIQDQLEYQPPYFIPAWLMNRSRQTNKDDRLRRAAVVTGNVDIVIQIYDRAICHWAYRGLFHETCVMLSELAVIYRQDCHAIKMAEDILSRMLGAMLKDESLQVDSKLLSIIIMERFDIYFDRYSKARNKTAKEPLCHAASALIADVRVADVIESSTKATVLITLAKMWRGIGFKYRAYQYADHAFKLCIVDLEDRVDDNDMDAFRALTKVLHFAGLSKDAGIAASLIFDKANANALEVSDEEYRNTLFSAVITEHPPSAETLDLHITTGSDDAFAPPFIHEHEHEHEHAAPLSASSIATDPTEKSPTTAATTPCSGSIQETTKVIDEGNGSLLQCMGPCGKDKLNQWELGSPAWFFCLDCPSTDYCNECYNTKDANKHSQDKGLWSKVCWGKHTLIQQPILGWKGVKDGVIRVGGSSRGVKDWMLDMKERWALEMRNNSKKRS